MVQVYVVVAIFNPVVRVTVALQGCYVAFSLDRYPYNVALWDSSVVGKSTTDYADGSWPHFGRKDNLPMSNSDAGNELQRVLLRFPAEKASRSNQLTAWFPYRIFRRRN